MKFAVEDLVRFDMHDKLSLGIIKVVTDDLIHLIRLEDKKWFMFYDETYDRVVENFGQMTLEKFQEKYPEYLI